MMKIKMNEKWHTPMDHSSLFEKFFSEKSMRKRIMLNFMPVLLMFSVNLPK